jgi:hypothetical protein
MKIMYQSPSLKRAEVIGIRFSLIEKRFLDARAKQARIPTRDYIRTLALEGKIKKEPALPPEFLSVRAQLHHACSLLFPFSTKRLDGDELNALERAEAKQLIQTIRELVTQLINYQQ